MRILPVPLRDAMLSELRARNLDSLAAPQDMYSESLIRSATSYLLSSRGKISGYSIVAPSGTLLEFYASDEHANAAFDQILRNHRISKALCKSFDKRLLELCKERMRGQRPIGLLFTSVVDEAFHVRPGFIIRAAQQSDLSRIQEIDDGFFDTAEELRSYIEQGNLQLYEKAEELVACGLVQPVIEDRPYRDLGMLVKPSRRKRGIGTYVIRHLKASCLEQGLRPICCCDVGNAASRRCLEAAGFRGSHRIIEFALGADNSPPPDAM